MTISRQGTIVTFYSYKGGTGRSMALANVAWLLASAGHRVLMIDWDLESPGLHRFFHPLLLDVRMRSTRGLMDLLWDFSLAAVSPLAEGEDAVDWYAPYTDVHQYSVSVDWTFQNDGVLRLLPAGRQDDVYATRVASFDWTNFYERLNGGAFLEAVKDVLRAEFDYILLDSRTGLSDTSGICTVQLPDVLVCCFTLSNQSVEGAAAVATSVLAQRTDPGFRILPVPMRVEDGEHSKLDAGRSYAHRMFDHVLEHMTAEDRERYWADVEVPYRSFYAYEEVLAAVADRPRSAGTVLAALERLVSHLTWGATTALVAGPEVERSRLLARFERGGVDGETYDFFISYSDADRAWATWIAWVLAEAGYAVFFDRWEGSPGDAVARLGAIERAERVMVVLSPAYLRSPRLEMEALASAGSESRTRGRVIPVVIEAVDERGPLSVIVSIDLRGLDERTCQRMLLNASTTGGLQPSPLSTHRAAPPINRGGRPTFPGRSPAQDAPVRLAQAQALLATLPTDAVPPAAPLPAGSRMPIGPNPLFVGRGEELLQLAAALRGGTTSVALGQVVASTGLSGIGKTQLAVELVHRYGRFFAGGVFWLNFASAGEIPLQVAACAGSGAVGLEADVASQPVEERVKLVTGAWQSPWPRLLVFDNCEDESLLEAWRPMTGDCRVLVTSRRSYWSPTLGVTVMPLDLLPRPDSVELLRRYRPDLPPGDAGLDAIASELGDLPLALHLAGSYLRNYQAEVSVHGYLAELRGPVLITHASLLGGRLDDSSSPTHHVQSLVQAFALCLGRLDREREVDRVALAVLARMACLAPGEAVPRDLLSRTLPEVEPLRLADGLRRLAAVGLADEGAGWLRLHRLLVHFVRQEGLDPDAQPSVARALIACGENAEQGQLTGPALAAVIPHLVEVAGAAIGGAGDERMAVELCAAAGRALHHAGELGEARPWYDRALAIRQRALGADHPDTAASLNDLAELLYAQGELAPARELFQRSLDVRLRTLGADHAGTAESLNNLAEVLRDQGELVAARPLLERALAIWERVLGPDHPHTATSLNNLGMLLRDHGELAAARARLERALSIWERVLGSDHPHTATGLDNVALLLQNEGKLDAALPLFERALVIHERVLGPDHPDTAWSLNNLGNVLLHQGELAAARPLFERALVIHERVLGPDHPDTAWSLNNLGHVLMGQGELAAARPLFERALAIQERVLGPDHPDTAWSLNNLDNVLQIQGEPTAGRPLFERVRYPETGAGA